MEESQARIKVNRLQVESNLAKQPYSELEEASSNVQGEANVVELPNRPLPLENVNEDVSIQRSAKRKSSNLAKPKKPTGGLKQTSISFRRMREVNQQPFADELKRLEAQAERINQLVAERAAKQEPSHIVPEQYAATEQHIFLEQHVVTEQTEPIGETTLFPAKQYSNLIDSQSEPQLLDPQVPQLIEHPLTQDEWEAAQTAEALRYLAGRHRLTSTTPIASPTHPSSVVRRDIPAVSQRPTLPTEPRKHPGRSRSARSASRQLSTKRYRLRLGQLLQLPHKPLDRIGDAVLWIVLSSVLHLGMKLLIATFPVLSPVFSLLMLAPAALAVYLSICVPQVGFVSVYRLFLIMLGLLIGSKLW